MNRSLEDRSYSLILAGLVAVKLAAVAKAALALKAAAALVVAANSGAIASTGLAVAGGIALGRSKRLKAKQAEMNYLATKKSLQLAKSSLAEARGTVIASKIARKGLTNKLPSDEKKFLKGQGGNLAKGVALGGLAVGANVGAAALSPALVAVPGLSEAALLAGNRMGIKIKRQEIPKSYSNSNKFSKANNWLDERSKRNEDRNKLRLNPK